jgi:hypothetical protein
MTSPNVKKSILGAVLAILVAASGRPAGRGRVFQDELQGSVGERIKVTSQLGPEQKHGERQGAEQKLIKQIDRIIKDREPK